MAGLSQSTGAQTTENPGSRTDMLFDFYRSGPLHMSGGFSSSPGQASAKQSLKLNEFQASSSAKEFAPTGKADLSNVSSEAKKFRKLGLLNNVSLRNPPSSAAHKRTRAHNMSLGGGRVQPPTAKAAASSKLNKTAGALRRNATVSGPA